MNALQYCQESIAALALLKGEVFAKEWVRRRMEFVKYQGPFVFSTRFGLFFDEVAEWLQRKDFLKPDVGEELSEYDKGFNTWLKNERKNLQTN